MSSDDIHAQAAVEIDGYTKWYNHCCTDLVKKPVARPGRLGGMRAILIAADRLWDNGQILTVSFVHPIGSGVQRDKVKRISKEWERYANLKFFFVDDNNQDATIRISFNLTDGSWSYVGTDNLEIAREKATMNFGAIGNRLEITPQDRGVILHEFGHAIGYLHEHQSPRRAETLTLKEAAVIEFYMQTQGWTEQRIREQILNIYNVQDVSNFSAIDLKSIMMYFMPGEMNVENITVPPNNALSASDKAFAFLNYPTLGPSAAEENSKLNSALRTLKISDEFKASIRSECAERDWEGVRAEFTRWSVNEKAIANKARIQAEREQSARAVVAQVEV